MLPEKWPLKSYLPSSAHLYCYQLQKTYQFQVKITRPRSSKLGDYRFNNIKKTHLITINGDLNPYTFLVVYLHEVAHCLTAINQGLSSKPHGKYWQRHMTSLLRPMLNKKVFPEDIETAIVSYLQSPKATSCAHPALTRALRKYDPESSLVSLEQIESGENFVFQSKSFQKLDTRRTRVKCQQTNNGRMYLISRLALVQPLGLSEG